MSILPGGLTMRDGGWRGYDHSAWIVGGTGRAGWSPGVPRRGLHLSMPGSCLDALATLDSWFSDVSGLIGCVQDELGGHITRMDLCWDDRAGLLDFEVIREALENGEYTSRWRRALEVAPLGDPRGSKTLYLGSKASDARLRVYDKAAEQGVDGHWVRVELVARRKRADGIAADYKLLGEDPSGTGVRMAGILRSLIDFKKPSEHSDRSRWPTVDWWSEFLGSAERARLARREPPRTVDDIERWIGKQVTPSLAVLEAVRGEDEMWSWLHERVDAAKPRLGARHRAIIAAANKDQDLELSEEAQ